MPTRFLLLSCSLLLAPGCDGDSTPDRDGAEIADDHIDVPVGALPPLAYTLTTAYDGANVFDLPESLTGHLVLDVAADGAVSGTLSALDRGVVALRPISGQVRDRAIVFEEGEFAFGFGRLEIDELRIELRDGDEDGAVDGAIGEAAGTYRAAAGDVSQQGRYTSDLSAGLDTTPTILSLRVPRQASVLMPYDAVEIFFDEVLRGDEVRDRLRLLAGGQPIEGELTLGEELVAGAVFQPRDFLPFAAELTVDLGGLADLSGNQAAPVEGISVAADPGALTSPGFESGTEGWLSDRATVEGSFQGFAPVEGAAQGVVTSGATLAAVVDVDADASALDFAITVLTEAGIVDADRTTVVALRGPGGQSLELFDVADVQDQQQKCTTCTDYRVFVGPLRRTADLTPFRGQRVFLSIDVRSSFFIGLTQFAALVDDVQVR